MSEKGAVAFAKNVDGRLSVSAAKTILGTTTVTDEPYRTFAADSRQLVAFIQSERPLSWQGDEVPQMRLIDVSESVDGIHEVVA